MPESFPPLVDALGEFRVYPIHLTVDLSSVRKGSNDASKEDEEEIIRTWFVDPPSGSTQPTSDPGHSRRG